MKIHNKFERSVAKMNWIRRSKGLKFRKYIYLVWGACLKFNLVSLKDTMWKKKLFKSWSGFGLFSSIWNIPSTRLSQHCTCVFSNHEGCSRAEVYKNPLYVLQNSYIFILALANLRYYISFFKHLPFGLLIFLYCSIFLCFSTTAQNVFHVKFCCVVDGKVSDSSLIVIQRNHRKVVFVHSGWLWKCRTLAQDTLDCILNPIVF